MGILDEIERIDDEEVLKSSLRRIEKLEEENKKMLKEVLRMLKMNQKREKSRGGK
ncbi:MAG: hypothetical protein JXA22_02690 [Candidatus Thermoplasmatota archaeon]|nr:hypothetical protein [Candidatus Thermoplasmatota archaeon]